MKKSPPIYLYPLMFASALAAIIIVGWAFTRTADLKGDRDDWLYYHSMASRP